MQLRLILVGFALILPALAGCISPTQDVSALSNGEAELVASGGLAFTPVVIIDALRAGGEPVITFTPKGTLLVSAHPGWTHTRYPPSANLLTPATGQSYVWRSTDNGDTWAPIGLPMADGAGPRGVGQGVSDPDFAVDSNGRIYLTDLEALAAASVSWSDDDGETWLMGNNVASTYGPVDRQWLATHGTDVYFMGNYFAEERVLKSTDGGLTWLQVGRANCAGDLIVRDDGAIIVGCNNGIDVSTDGGKKFTRQIVPNTDTWARGMTEPAIDSAGNVYTAWANKNGVWYAGTSDLGQTWSTPVNVALGLDIDDGTNIWPWMVAGDDGRVAVVWYGVDNAAGPARAKGDWHVYHATVLDAMGAAPEVYGVRATDTPVFKGIMCQSGTTCQADPSANGDRRMGDFFEAAIDPWGMVHTVFSVALGDAISHPGYVRQTSGPSLYLTPRLPAE